MTDIGMEAAGLESGDELLETPKEPSFVARAIKKLLKWTVMIIVGLVFYKFIGGLQAEQKQDLFAEAKQQAIFACGSDSACMAKVKTHFNACIEGNYTSYRKGKYSRKYVFDPDGFQGCIDAK